MNEHGEFGNKTERKLVGKTEQEIYELFGISFIPPEMRIGENELNKYKLT